MSDILNTILETQIKQDCINSELEIYSKCLCSTFCKHYGYSGIYVDFKIYV